MILLLLILGIVLLSRILLLVRVWLLLLLLVSSSLVGLVINVGRLQLGVLTELGWLVMLHLPHAWWNPISDWLLCLMVGMGPISSGGILLLSEELNKSLIKFTLRLKFPIEVSDLGNLSVVNRDSIQNNRLNVFLLYEWISLIIATYSLLHDILVKMVLDKLFFSLEIGKC
jgi:hypothetical protein